MRVLIIDDSKAVRMVLRKMFQGLGWQTAEAADGEQGLKSLRENGLPDMVTVDWDMPVMDGLAFVRAVRETPGWEKLPLLMVTAANGMGQLMAALEAGADEYIMKPFTEEMIREKMGLLAVLET